MCLLILILYAHHVSENEAKSLLCRFAKVASLGGSQDVGVPETWWVRFFKAITTKPNLLMNFMNFSRHQKQHLHKQSIALNEKQYLIVSKQNSIEEHTLTTGLSAPFSSSLSWMYCSINRIILMIAMINDPKARVPVWYLNNKKVQESLFRIRKYFKIKKVQEQGSRVVS